MDPSVLAALQQLYQLAGPLFGGMSGGAPSMGAVTGGGASGGGGGAGGWIQALINLLLSGSTAYGAGKYGSSELNSQQQLQQLQMQAIRQAMGLRTGNLAQQTAQNTLPLDRRLAYTVSQAADQGTALRGMSQSPGAVAAGEATALAPYAEQNLQLGGNLALAGNQLALDKLQFPFKGSTPDYLTILGQLGQLGSGSAVSPLGNSNALNQLAGLFGGSGTFGLPQGAPGTA